MQALPDTPQEYQAKIWQLFEYTELREIPYTGLVVSISQIRQKGYSVLRHDGPIQTSRCLELLRLL